MPYDIYTASYTDEVLRLVTSYQLLAGGVLWVSMCCDGLFASTGYASLKKVPVMDKCLGQIIIFSP